MKDLKLVFQESPANNYPALRLVISGARTTPVKTQKDGKLFQAKQVSTGKYFYVHAVPRRCEPQIEAIKLKYRQEALANS